MKTKFQFVTPARRNAMVPAALLFLSMCFGIWTASGQSPLPMVAVHDSEYTRALATMPATGQTPRGPQNTGFQWWSGEWNYFVMPESVKEMLRSDGTAYQVVGDADIAAGGLLINGQPKYPILISLAAEAIRDDEIAQLTNYVAAGGFLFMGSSSFTRFTNGAPRGNFPMAAQMGVRLTYFESAGGLNNWINVTNVVKATEHRIVEHIPFGAMLWRMPEWQNETIWDVSPDHNPINSHDVWAVSNDNPTNTATVLLRSADGLTLPYLTVQAYGKGYYIYYAPMQPLMGFGGYAPGMYAYRIFRNSIEWAFETLGVPVAKLSPWPYEYDAAFSMRHDLENFQFEISNIEASAQYEQTNGVKGDYYFCTGTLRQELANSPAVIASLRRAITNYGATIASHNGGLPNPVNQNLQISDYDYWHWGPDEALDVTPAGYASGRQYATISLSNSFVDIDTWTAGINTGVRKFAGCYFNSSREDSNEILEQLGVRVTGEHKLGPFPHWTLSTRVPNKRFPMLTIPVSDWFVNGTISQSLDYGSFHDTNSIRAAVDAYYNLGALINLYTHSLADGQGVAGAGNRVPEYIRYSMDANLHPRLWSANAQLIYDWWVQRANAQVTATHYVGAYETTTTINVTGAVDPRTSVEILLPTTNIVSGIEVLTNGVAAFGDVYRLKGRNLKVRVGNTINLVEIRVRTGADAFFADNFTRASYPAGVSPWVVFTNAWSINDGEMRGGPNPPPQNYGYAYLTNQYGPWTDFAVAASIKFPAGAFGGGLGGRLNPATGAHYGLWIYPEGSSFGSSVMSLIKFQGWSSFGYNGSPGAVMQTVSLPGVGTNWHRVKLAFSGNRIAAYYDGNLALTATDTEAQPHSGGGICLDQYTEFVPYQVAYDDLVISPLAAADQFNVTANTTLTVPAPGVLTNDSQFTLGPGLATLSSPPVNGSVTLNSNGGFTYTPNLNFTGTDSFIYVAGDGVNTIGSATVTLFVNPTHNGPSLAVQTDRTILEGSTLIVTNTAADTDIPPPILTYTLTAAPTNATVSTNGIITWTPTDAQGGSTNLFTTIVTDNRLVPFSATNTFRVIVLDTNSAPVLPPQTTRYTGKQITLTVSNTAVDVDVPVDQLTYELTTAPVGAAISPAGVITWTPGAAQDRTTNLFTTVVSDNGAPVLRATNSFVVIVESTPEISLLSAVITSEGCPLVNNAIDPGETLTMTFTLRNTGRGDTANLIATLLETNGVVIPSAPQDYAVLVANGAPVSRSFTFAAVGDCGGTVTPRLRLQDGATVLGEVQATFPMGITGTFFAQNFDSVAAPALPAGWTTSATGAQPLWNTQTAFDDTAPNAAGTTGAATPGVNQLVSPPMLLPSASAQLSFRHSYNLEPGTTSTTAFDGAVLEISIGTNAFVDILAAGGTFSAGGYNRTILTGFGNPLAGRQAWSGAANSFSTVIVELPAAALGQSVRFRWRCAADNTTASAGWRVDGVSVAGTGCCVSTSPVLPVQNARTLTELTPLVVTNTVIDTGIPGAALSYQLLAPPAGATVSAAGIITWTPAENQGPSTNVLTTVASYNGVPALHATNSFLVIVTETNATPVLPVQADRSIPELALMTVTNTASDADIPVNNVSYVLVAAPPGASISAAGLITWTPGENAGPSVNTFTTVATDSGSPGRSATNTFIVTVTEGNSAPVLPVQMDRTIDELTSLLVTNTAADFDVPANTLTYALLNPPAGATINSSGVIQWTPAEHQGPSTNVITTVVLDNGAPVLGATNSFAVVVREINVAPVLPLQTNQFSSGLAAVVITNTATDADAPLNALTYELLAAPAGVTISSNGIIAWTPVVAQVPGTNVITTRVTDANPWAVNAQNLSATNSFTLTINAVHFGPNLPFQVNRRVTEHELLIVTNTAAVVDVPPLTLSYALINAPAGAAINPNGIITWTPSEIHGPGNFQFTTVVLDDGIPQLSAVNSFTVTVDEWNQPPVLPLQPDRSSVGIAPVIVTNTASDVDLPGNGLAYQLVSGPPNATINSNGVISWTPTINQVPGTNVLTTVVTDSSPSAINAPALRATNSFTVVVNPLFSPPLLPVQTTRTINELMSLVVTNTATDANIPALGLSYVLRAAPSGATINANGVITWSPGESQGPSTNVFTTVVSDYGSPALKATNTFTVIVAEVNGAPLLPDQPSRTLAEQTLLTVTNTATDADAPANTLSYSLATAPAGAVINSSGVISWTPTEFQSPSTNVFTTVVADNGSPVMKHTNVFTVVVTEVNLAPVLTVQTNHTLAEQTLLVVTNAATDADYPANLLTYALLNPPAGASIDSAGVITWTPSEAQGPSTNQFVTVVTDNGLPARSVTNAFTVVVTEVNIAPVLLPLSEVELFELTTLTRTNAATDVDLPANTISYAFLSAPAGAAINSNGVVTWTPDESFGPGTYSFTTVATDNGTPLLGGVNTFTVRVREVNAPPVLPVQADRTLSGIQALTVTNTATDTDVPANPFSYQLVQAPAGAVINASGIITWTPTLAQVPSTNLFLTVVTDSNPGATPASLAASNSFTVIVKDIHHGPSLTVIPPWTVMEQTAVTITNTAGQDNVPAFTLHYALVNPPAGASIDTNGIIAWTPTEQQGPATNTLITVVTDSGTPPLSVTNYVTVMVLESNRAPVLPPQTNRTLAGLESLTVHNQASDPDAPANGLTYQLAQAPVGASINSAGLVQWTPAAAQVPGVYVFRTVVTDQNPEAVNAKNLSATNEFTVTVNPLHNGPELPVQPNQVVSELNLLTVTNTAANFDVPVTTLTYSLINPPAGAEIDANGVITWMPSESQGGNTHTITTLVVDDGDPVKFDLNMFTVTVVDRPRIQRIVVTNGVAAITWSSVAGQKYRLQQSAAAAASAWQDVGGEVTAAGATTTQTTSVSGVTQRYFRVRLAP